MLWTFSIYLEAVAILPQLVLLQRTNNIDNLTGNYVFLLGCATGGCGATAKLGACARTHTSTQRTRALTRARTHARTCAQDVPRALHNQLGVPLFHGAALPTVGW